MKTLKLTHAFLGVLLLLNACCSQEEYQWTTLLDDDLSQWEVYLSFRHQNGYDGSAPVDSLGTPIEPVGFNNLNEVFKMETQEGSPVLHVSGEYYGCVFTKSEYSNYHLTLKYKWGDKKWSPRESLLKDTGVLYHSIGEPGVDYWRAWMLSQELQIMEGHTGDYWSIANSAIDVRAFIPEGAINTMADHGQDFLPIGAGSGNSGYAVRTANYESNEDGWTTVDLICFEDKSLHIVNGQVVMVLQNSRYVEDGKSIALAKGKIQLQSEAAEVFYKDIKIRSIDGWSDEHRLYFE